MILKLAQTVGFVFLCVSTLFAQRGAIQGVVKDAASTEPLIGVNVILRGTSFGDATDENGNYLIKNLDVGGYTVVFSIIGYGKKVVTDVIVNSNKTSYVSAQLKQQLVATDSVVVTASSYFTKILDAPISLHGLNHEEVRRSPGSREDVSRMIQNLPGVSATTDDRNDLVIRGGSPSEVLYLIDNIEIPNPNHFGTQGATGGPITLINNEFIENVNFMAGGFPAKYGNKLSGVLDIRLREGDPSGLRGKFDLNFAGAGGIFEGGLPNRRGSWLLALHRSYLELMEGALDIGGVPIYSNFQGKMVYQLTPSTKLSIIGIGGIDKIELDPDPDYKDYQEGEIDTTDIDYIINETTQATVGINLSKVWSAKLFSNFTIAHSYHNFLIDYNRRFHEVTRPAGKNDIVRRLLPNGHHDVYDNTSVEQTTNIKSDWMFLFDNRDELAFGVQAKFLQFDHDIVYQPFDTVNAVGRPATGTVVDVRQNITPKLAAYLSLSKRWTSRLTTNFGLRYDYFKLLGTQNLSPRFSMSYAVSDRLTFNAAAGTFHQSPEFVYITGDPRNKDTLKSIRSNHFITGLDYLLTDATLFSVEVYRKNYYDYPVASDPDFSFYSTANSGANYGSGVSQALVSEGKGNGSGFEIMLQKKLVSGLYGLTSYSYSKIKHQAMDRILRPGEFDNRHVLNLILGYRLNKSWEFSLKWRYAGGKPFTPFDVNASKAAQREILDVSHINTSRFKPYHRLDLRYDYRKYFKRMTMVSYFSLENVYNRANQGYVFWNKKLGKTEFYSQTGFFPVGGVSLEF